MPDKPENLPPLAERPRIAICAEFEEWQPSPGKDRGYLKLYHHYYHAISRAGALPFIVPTFEDPSMAIPLLESAHAVLLTGGDDFHPARFDDTLHPATRLTPSWRDEQDALVATWLLEESKQPVLAICAGMQALAIASGGAIIQDLPSLSSNVIEHGNGNRHRISVNRDSRLFSMTGGSVDVNSFHHQAIAHLGPSLRPVALAGDGVCEAYESRKATRFLLGVQWHPELDADEPNNEKLFASFVRAATKFAKRETASDLPVNLP